MTCGKVPIGTAKWSSLGNVTFHQWEDALEVELMTDSHRSSHDADPADVGFDRSINPIVAAASRRI